MRWGRLGKNLKDWQQTEHSRRVDTGEERWQRCGTGCGDGNVTDELTVYHCIIDQKSLCGNALKMEHEMSITIRAVNFIRAKGLNHRQLILGEIESMATWWDIYVWNGVSARHHKLSRDRGVSSLIGSVQWRCFKPSWDCFYCIPSGSRPVCVTARGL